MRILVCAGKRTQGLVEQIQRKFQSSGDSFLSIPYIEEINGVYELGEFFDKALITDRGITHDNEIEDTNVLREKVNSFASYCGKRKLKQFYIFLSERDDLANLIYEEITPMDKMSIVLSKQGPYSIGFFFDVLVKDASDLPRDWVYNPPISNNEQLSQIENSQGEESDTFVGESNGFENVPDGFPGMDDSEDIFGDMFGSEDGSDDGSNTMMGSFSLDGGFFDRNQQSFEAFAKENFADNNEPQENMKEQQENKVVVSLEKEPLDESSGEKSNIENVDANNFEMPMSSEDTFGESDEKLLDDFEISGGEQVNFAEQQNQGDGFNGNFVEKGNFGEAYNGAFGNQSQDAGFENSQPQEMIGNFGQDIVQQPEQFNQQPIIGSNFGQEMANQPMSEQTPVENEFNDDMYSGQAQSGNISIPGFDDDATGFNGQSSQENQEDLYDDSMYSKNIENSGQLANTTLRGYDEDDYNQTTSNQGGEVLGFDQDEYDSNQQNNSASFAAGMAVGMAGGAMVAGANGMEVGANMMNGMADIAVGMIDPYGQQGMMNSQPNLQMHQQPEKKKGLFGRNNNQNSNMMNPNGQQMMANQMDPMGQQMMQGQPQQMNNVPKVNVASVQGKLKPFAARGNSIVVTGCGGCGTSTVAFNLANIISALGFTVLLVDMDIDGRSQNYISKNNYNSMDSDGVNLISAINSSTGISNYTSVVKPGMHLLTLGIGADVNPINEAIHKEKISRFINLAKTSYNFVVYDIPFRYATGYLSEMTYMADNLVVVADASNWGVTKLLIAMCNIDSDEMQDTMFSRAQLVFNKYRSLCRVFGKKVKTCADITKAMDQKVYDLLGQDIGLYFRQMHIAGVINDDQAFENGWYEDAQYSDTAKGQQIFLNIIESIVMKS